MKVLNIHIRTIDQSLLKIAELLTTLSTQDDKIWPIQNWPKMKFKDGIQIGAVGGHGLIRYKVEKFIQNEIIQFRFLKPIGFEGIHKFEIKQLSENKTEIKHTIDMNTRGISTFLWIFAIRSLHDALIEDGFDNMENNFSEFQKSSKWSYWVKLIMFCFRNYKN